jgi:hypothetical protein
MGAQLEFYLMILIKKIENQSNVVFSVSFLKRI